MNTRAAIAAFAVLVSLGGVDAAARASPAPPTSPSGCGPEWQIVPSPRFRTGEAELNSVSAVSATDVWAVGANPGADAIAEHWDGTSWHVVHTAPPETGRSLMDVTAVGPDDVWAVGYSGTSKLIPLAEHWDGTSWTAVDMPSPPSDFGSMMLGVAAVSSDDVWATGWTSNSQTDPILIEHWDGSTWTIYPTSSREGFLQDAAVAGANVWAVGYDGAKTLIERWDGQGWRRAPSPSPGSAHNFLFGAAGASSSDGWAVGHGNDGSGRGRDLALHWDGVGWTSVPTPTPGTGAGLNGVAARATDAAWAVGYVRRGDAMRTQVIEWDGAAWALVPSPNATSRSNALNDVALVGSDGWAVGFATLEPFHTTPLIVRACGI